MAKQQTKRPPAIHQSRTQVLSPLQDFVRKNDLAEHLATAERLAAEAFRPTTPPRIVLEQDPETAERYVEVGLTLKAGHHAVLDAYNEYTRRWVAAVPPRVVGSIRIAYELV